MRNVWCAILLGLVFPIATSAQDAKGIKFQDLNNWSTVLSKAKAEGKYIFVDAYTTWCGPCKEMDAHVFPNDQLGTIINDEFIAVKVQMDSAKNDDLHTVEWRHDAKTIMSSAKIDAFPSLLFYSPSGKLVLKSVGYKDPVSIMTIAKFASDSIISQQFSKDMESYKVGELEASQLKNLSRTVREILNQRKLATKIALEYKEKVLSKIPNAQNYLDDDIKFIRENDIELVKVDDPFFKLCIQHPQRVDTVLEQSTALNYVTFVVIRDLIRSKLYVDGKAITKKPDWKELGKPIQTKFPKLDVPQIMLDEKVAFYWMQQDWQAYTAYMSEKIAKYPPQVISGGMEVFMALNDPAWKVFLGTNDPIALNRALQWSDESIRLEDNPEYYDTKANILYRLKRVNEAIAVEEMALAKEKAQAAKEGRTYQPTDIFMNLEKMKKGVPTWHTSQ